MIIVKLQGGLGNQMFQYAAAFGLAKNKKTILKIDKENYNNDTKRKYSLFAFMIKEEFASLDEIKNFLKFKKRNGNILARAYSHFRSNEFKYWQEKQFTFDQGILNINNDCYLDGYFQSEKYFENAVAEIRSQFVLKPPINETFKEIEKKIGQRSVSIHIRRGDYVDEENTNKFHGVCTLEYYNKAIFYIKRKLQNNCLSFFVFSDDIEWTKNNLRLQDEVSYISNAGLHDYEELMLMSKCNHNIIANSSFSWWGAWLNNFSNKIVIAPKKWFNKPVNTKDLFSSNWIQM